MTACKIRLVASFYDDTSLPTKCCATNLFILSYILHRWLGRNETWWMFCRMEHNVMSPELLRYHYQQNITLWRIRTLAARYRRKNHIFETHRAKETAKRREFNLESEYILRLWQMQAGCKSAVQWSWRENTMLQHSIRRWAASFTLRTLPNSTVGVEAGWSSEQLWTL
jgi:hypothetical protein